MSGRLKVWLSLPILLATLFCFFWFFSSVRLRIGNDGDLAIKNIVLQGRGIGKVIYEIPPHETRLILVRPALETDLRFEYSKGDNTYKGMIDEYFAKGCSATITLALNSHNNSYRWQGWVRDVCFGTRIFVTNSSVAKVVVAEEKGREGKVEKWKISVP